MMLRRLLQCLLATLLMMAGPVAAWAALAPPEASCCEMEGCSCPAPAAPRAPLVPLAPPSSRPASASAVVSPARARRLVPRAPLAITFRTTASALRKAPLPVRPLPPPEASTRRAQLSVFRI